MSMTTWTEEFYPIPAAKSSEKDAAEHSLKKWIGLRPENLSRHGLRTVSIAITDGKTALTIDGLSCALCKHHNYVAQATTYRDCPSCPIVAVNGGRTCLNKTLDGRPSPWHQWVNYHEVEPMIELLERTVEYVKTQV